MKNQKLYFGLHFKQGTNIEDSVLKELAFLLFASPSVAIDEAKAILNNADTVKIVEYSKMIKEEIQEFKASFSNVGNDEYNMFPELNPVNRILKKLESWIDEFTDTQINELELVADYYKIDRDLIKGIIGRKNMEYPEDVFNFLSKSIIGQEDALKKLSVITASYKKTQDIEIQKQVPLLVGDTGTGKTLLGSSVGKLLSSNYIRLSCTQLVPEGIKGETISDSLTNLRLRKGHFKTCVLHFDEVDKLVANFSSDIEYSRKLQFELLNILEKESIIRYPESFERNAKYIEINSKNIFVILSGAFHGIEKHIIDRLKNNRNSIFENDNLKKNISSEDIQNYGILPELAGRITSVIALDTLKSADIKNIIKLSLTGALSKHTQNLAQYDVKLTMTDSALEYISEKAVEQKLGARYADNILNDLTYEVYFHSKSLKGQTIVIDKTYIDTYQFINEHRNLIKVLNKTTDLRVLAGRFNTTVDTILDVYNYWNKIKKGGNYVFIQL